MLPTVILSAVNLEAQRSTQRCAYLWCTSLWERQFRRDLWGSSSPTS